MGIHFENKRPKNPENRHLKNNRTKITLLLPSLVITSYTSLSVATVELENVYPTIPTSLVDSIVTLPSITILIAIFLSMYISRFLSVKSLMLIGLALVGTGGIAPLFIENFWFLYSCRLVLGFGIGLFKPFAVSEISNFYQGKELSKMMGYQSATQKLGIITFLLLSGLLVSYQWSYVFIPYLVAFPILLFIAYNFQTTPTPQKSSSSALSKTGFSSIILLTLVTIFLVAVVLGNFYSKIAPLLSEKGYHDFANTLGIGLALLNFFALVGSLHFGRLYIKLKLWLPIGSVLIMALAFFLVAILDQLILIVLLMPIIGYAAGIVSPWTYTFILESVPKTNSTFFISLALISLNLGSFIAPFIFTTFIPLSITMLFFACSALLLMIACYLYFFVKSLNSHI
jgi:MFS family permease